VHLLLSTARAQLDDFMAEVEVAAGGQAAGTQEEVPGHKLAAHEVPRFGWHPEEAFAEQAALERLPLVLNNTQAVKWPLNAAGVGNLTALLPGSFRCRQHERKLFLLRDEARSKGPQMDSDRLIYPQWKNVTASDFLSSADRNPPYLYFSAAVEQFPAVNTRIQPRALFELDELAAGEKVGLKGEEPQRAVSQAVIWLSHPHVKAQMHHDRSHNFFYQVNQRNPAHHTTHEPFRRIHLLPVQIRGRKRVTLYDPAAHQQLHTYPAIAGARRQSQIDFEQAEAMVGSALVDLEAYRWEVELQPGDMLYIPPFWFHEVEALDLSVSVAVVSPSAQEQLFGELYWQRLPFASLDSTPKRVIGAQYYLCELLTRMIDAGVRVQGLELEKGGVRGFMQGILESRHMPMHALSTVSAKVSLEPTFECYALEADDDLRYTVISQVSPKLQDVFEKALALFNGEAYKRWWTPATAAILLSDYVEEILSWASGNPYDVKALLETCFPMATPPPSLRLSDPRATGGSI
jgi:hypothetical protein